MLFNQGVTFDFSLPFFPNPARVKPAGVACRGSWERAVGVADPAASQKLRNYAKALGSAPRAGDRPVADG
jgi:hypothetical protein